MPGPMRHDPEVFDRVNLYKISERGLPPDQAYYEFIKNDGMSGVLIGMSDCRVYRQGKEPLGLESNGNATLAGLVDTGKISTTTMSIGTT